MDVGAKTNENGDQQHGFTPESTEADVVLLLEEIRNLD
jgi:hypothetical protein